MKILKGIITVALTAALLLLASCNAGGSRVIDIGSLEGNTYTNKYFNMTMQLPANWTLQSGKPNKKSADASKEDNLDLSKEKTLTLAAAFKYSAIGEPDFNPSFISIADKITSDFKVKSGEEYLKGVKDSLIATQLPYEFSKDIYMENLSGKDFYVLEAQINAGDFVVMQKSYAAIFDKYVLALTFTYSNDEEYNELNDVIKSIKISQ